VEKRDDLFVDHISRTTSFVDPRLPASTQTLRRLKKPPTYDLFDDTHALQQRIRARVRQVLGSGNDEVLLEVRRLHLLEDSRLLFETRAEVLRRATNLRVHFVGEPGRDYGGMSTEFFRLLSVELQILFCQTTSYELFFDCDACSEDLACLVGKFVGLALLHGKLIELPLILPYYKFILGSANDVDLEDLARCDPAYYKSLVWLLENDVTGMGMVWVAGDVPLRDNGLETEVTEQDKQGYVRECVRHKLINKVTSKHGVLPFIWFIFFVCFCKGLGVNGSVAWWVFVNCAERFTV
jgi:E3 ubiquitin-protein ligase NEDD4